VNVLFDIYVQQFKTTLATQVQYRAALVIWPFGHILEPVTCRRVWDTVARSSGGRVGTFSTGDLLYCADARQPRHVLLAYVGV